MHHAAYLVALNLGLHGLGFCFGEPSQVCHTVSVTSLSQSIQQRTLLADADVEMSSMDVFFMPQYYQPDGAAPR